MMSQPQQSKAKTPKSKFTKVWQQIKRLAHNQCDKIKIIIIHFICKCFSRHSQTACVDEQASFGCIWGLSKVLDGAVEDAVAVADSGGDEGMNEGFCSRERE